MKKSRKEFIIEAHKDACSEWKSKIEKEFPKLFKKEISIGNWVKDDSEPKWLVYIGNEKRYGFNGFGVWFNEPIPYNVQPSDRLAIKEEVEEVLIKEAVKRGFKKDVVIYRDWFYISKKNTIYGNINNFKFYMDLNKLTLNGYTIFENGKWAEITAKAMTISEAEKQLNCKIIN